MSQLNNFQNPELHRLLDRFQAEDFDLEKTPQRPRGKKTRTLHLLWRGAQVAYLNPRLWREGALLGYRFNPGTEKARNACPANFDLEDFAQQHGLDPSADLRIRHDRGAGRSYLRVLNVDAALRLMRDSANAADLHAGSRAGGPPRDGGADEVSGDEDEWVASDLADLARRKDLDATTKQRLVDARVGQGQFRKDLEKHFGGACAVTRIRLREVLRASHIIPWARPTTDEERLDPNNGLLLAAHLDALFDRHLITFEQNGAMRISPRIVSRERDLLVLGTGLPRPPSSAQWHYLQQHNARFDEKEREHRDRTERANRRG